MDETIINHYPMAEALNPPGLDIDGTTIHFYGNGVMSISQRNAFSDGTNEVFLSRDLALGLSSLIKQRERMGEFNE